MTSDTIDEQARTEEGSDGAPRKRGFPWLILLPLLFFAGLAGVFYAQLKSGIDPAQIPSVMLGKKAPPFDGAPLPGLLRDGAQVPGLASADLAGHVSIVNVFASWCIPCREEHPILLQLAEDKRFRLVGINYKDNPDNARRFLGQIGNPFAAVGTDPSGRIGIDWGVYGVPESFVIAADGTIAYKFIGPLTEQSLRDTLMPEVEKALTQNKK
jgi:cytochrome c biogenesis protein CcmG/thiol:disulfide interchange protein DsbE